jgi:hypothetical protein
MYVCVCLCVCLCVYLCVCVCLCVFVCVSVNVKNSNATLMMTMPLCHCFWNISDPTGRIFMKFYVREFFENLWREFKVHQNVARIMNSLLEDRYSFLVSFFGHVSLSSS